MFHSIKFNKIMNYLRLESRWNRHYAYQILDELQEVRSIVAKTYAVIDEIVRLGDGLVLENAELVLALRAANARAEAAASELALFKAGDELEDARQLAAQDEDLANYGAGKAAQLKAAIDAAKADPSVPVTPDDGPTPGAEVKPEDVSDNESPAVVTDPEPVAEEPVAEGSAPAEVVQGSDDASVVIVEPGDIVLVEDQKDEDDTSV